jgi:hypothetical protein
LNEYENISYLFCNPAVESVSLKEGISSKLSVNKIIAEVPSSVIISNDSPNFKYSELISNLTHEDKKLITASYIHSSYIKEFDKYAISTGSDSFSLLSDLNFFHKKLIRSYFVFKNCGLKYDEIKIRKEKYDSNISLIKSSNFKSVESSFILDSSNTYDSAVIGLFNDSSISEVLRRISNEFDKLYSKRKYVHWYVGEGTDESEFVENREKFEVIVSKYEQCD